MSAERAPISSNPLEIVPSSNAIESPRLRYEQLWANMRADVATYRRSTYTDVIYRPGSMTKIDFERYHELQRELISQTKGYLPEEQQALEDALVLCNLHQVNNDREKRYRKKEDIPYANHPMEMALRCVEMGQDIKLIIACLLHDLPEDVSYLDLQSSEHVFDFIRWKFDGIDNNGDIVRIISAETKTTGAELAELRKPAVQKYLLESGIGRLIVDQSKEVLKTNGDLPNDNAADLSEKDKQTICAVIYDMCRIFETSFIDKDGEKMFDPRVLFVKILDSWDNLKTDAFWLANLESKAKGVVGTVAKLIRTRMFINLAETLGYRAVASEMTERLVKIHDINNIIRPGFGAKRDVDLRSWDNKKKQMESDVRRHFERRYPHRHVDVRCYSRMPWGQEPIEDVPTHLTPYVYVHIGREKAKEEIDRTKSNDANPEYFVGQIAMSLTGDIQNCIGRSTRDYVLEQPIRNKKIAVGKVRREDQSARWSATTRASHLHRANPHNSPEIHIMQWDLTKYACNFDTIPDELKNNGGKWVEAFTFFLSPRVFRRQGNRDDSLSFVVILNRKVFLAKNTVVDGSVWKMCEKEGIDPNNAIISSMAEVANNEPWTPLTNNPKLLTDSVNRKGKDPSSSHYVFHVKERHKKGKKRAAQVST